MENLWRFMRVHPIDLYAIECDKEAFKLLEQMVLDSLYKDALITVFRNYKNGVISDETLADELTKASRALFKQFSRVFEISKKVSLLVELTTESRVFLAFKEKSEDVSSERVIIYVPVKSVKETLSPEESSAGFVFAVGNGCNTVKYSAEDKFYNILKYVVKSEKNRLFLEDSVKALYEKLREENRISFGGDKFLTNYFLSYLLYYFLVLLLVGHDVLNTSLELEVVSKIVGEKKRGKKRYYEDIFSVLFGLDLFMHFQSYVKKVGIDVNDLIDDHGYIFEALAKFVNKMLPIAMPQGFIATSSVLRMLNDYYDRISDHVALEMTIFRLVYESLKKNKFLGKVEKRYVLNEFKMFYNVFGIKKAKENPSYRNMFFRVLSVVSNELANEIIKRS